MKKISKKTLILALSLILCFSVSIGIATAYFTDYESARGGAVLTLSGQTQLEEEMDGNNKTVKIANVGETDMIVRVQIIGDAAKLTIDAGSGWIKSEVDGWWYYTKILTPAGTEGAQATEIEAAVSGTVGETNFDIIVVHEASRTVYDGNTLVAPNGWDAAAVARIQ